jgi:acetoin utilization deacetylase AcuC-like enzyme
VLPVHCIYSDQHRLHATTGLRLQFHPSLIAEVPARAETILEALRARGAGPLSEPADHGLEPILAVHEADYLTFLQAIYGEYCTVFGTDDPVYPDSFAGRHGLRKPSSLLGLLGYYSFGVDSPILERTWEAAYWSAQCALSAADLVLAGERAAYALCRPPGHHAASDLYGGFCYLNNAAIAARALQADQPDRTRIAILDIDYHHGNGTQTIFYRDPSVLYCSLHIDPDADYPYYWGAADEQGAGAGLGFTRNWPLPTGTGDAEYLAVLRQAVEVVRDYRPRYLIVSAGFDLVKDDPVPVAGLAISTRGVGQIGQQIAELGLPTVVVQEGGYLLERLGENVATFLQTFD